MNQLAADLKAEIAHGQASRPAGRQAVPASKAPTTGKANPSTAKILKLYEDLTNLAVTDYRTEPAEHGLTDNDVYSCIVTANERSTCNFTTARLHHSNFLVQAWDSN